MALATLDDSTNLPATLASARLALAAHPLSQALAPSPTALAVFGSHYADLLARSSLGYTTDAGQRRLWTVSKRPLHGPDGLVWPNAFGIQRDDNDERLAVVGPRYAPLQSQQVAEAFDVAFAHIPAPFRPKLERAGSLGGSGRVYAQLALPPELSGLLSVPSDRESPTGAFLTLTNTHDGTSTAVLGASCVRIVCRNTWQLAHSQTKARGFALKHTVKNVKTYQESVTTWLKAVAEGYAAQGQRMRAYSAKPLSVGAVARAVDEILFGEVKETKTRQQKANADSIIEMIEGRDGQFVQTGEVTAYSVFNAFTAYTMHRKPARGELAAQTETRLWNVLTDDDIAPRAFVVLDAV